MSGETVKAEGVTFEKILHELRHKVGAPLLERKKGLVERDGLSGGILRARRVLARLKCWTGSSPRTMQQASKIENNQNGDADQAD